MQLNPSKCFVMRITRKRDPVIYDYKLMGHSIESVSQHPYLGVELSSKLDWGHHIGDCEEELPSPDCRQSVGRQATDRPPWTDKHMKQIEDVQRRAARFVKNCWQRTPGTVSNLLNDLDWPSLQNRRKSVRLTLLHRY